MVSNKIKPALILTTGSIVGLLLILLISVLLLFLLNIEIIDNAVIGIPTILGGFSGLIIAYLLMKNNRQKRELKANELKLRTLIDLSLDGIYLENEKGEILDCNTMGHNMFGYTREEMLKLSIRDLVPTEFAGLLPDIIPEEMATGDVYLERENMKKDGTIFPTEINTKFVNLNGQRRLIAYVRDISRQKNTEAILKDMITTKDKLFSIIGHDLKGSLNSIQGFSELLISDIGKLPNEDIQQYLQFIYQSADHANSLLANLLNWALIQTDRIHYCPRQLSINSIISNVFNQISDQADSKNILLKNNSEADLKVMADEEMLKTILRNLLANAIKYSYPEGKIRVKAHSKKNKVVLSVVDQGTGMTSDIIENLFNMNQSKIHPGTNYECGTGLGLIICQEFAEKHGGRIHVESKPGKGTIFYLELPINQELEQFQETAGNRCFETEHFTTDRMTESQNPGM
ncbi:PAS domain-containing sensor histidine kinase [Mangrovibacterium lignilyticum]|uniref:PAS domain-containing sensor histidine kinase n=1 Tax=Mangrovibacterium lignilyticum TaxID=2668052 RepID=UPI0013D26435|nr:PAS domain-containing sensor histidine kinase [Mangrovibacterium lignilyticum]